MKVNIYVEPLAEHVLEPRTNASFSRVVSFDVGLDALRLVLDEQSITITAASATIESYKMATIVREIAHLVEVMPSVSSMKLIRLMLARVLVGTFDKVVDPHLTALLRCARVLLEEAEARQGEIDARERAAKLSELEIVSEDDRLL